MTTHRWIQEFEEFVRTEEISPPSTIAENIHRTVAADLHPSWAKVSLKATLVHLVVGNALLLICPQFGVGGFSGLVLILMKFGHEVCMFTCGLLFLGTSALVMGLVLRPEEVRVLRRIRWFPFLALSLGSLAVLSLLGAQILFLLMLVWLVGTLVGGIAGLELGWLVRLHLRGRTI